MRPNLSNPDLRPRWRGGPLLSNGRSVARSRPAGRRAGVCVVLILVILALVPASALATGSEASCPNAQLRTEQPFASALPDCRAYEMVSPLEKDDNGVTYIDSRAAVSGEAVTYLSTGSFADPKSALLEDRYLARREAGGWSTQNISPPYTDYRGNPLYEAAFGELLFTPDLSSGILESWNVPLVSSQSAGYVDLYVADTASGSYEPVTTVTPEAEYKPFSENAYDQAPQAEGASTDLSHVVFQQIAGLCCGASPKLGHVYEWAAGKLSLVDVPPKGVTFEGTDDVGSPANFGQPSTHGNPWHAVSTDGSRVVFTGAVQSFGLAGQVYVRENPMSAVEDCSVSGDACTVEVSASQRTTPDPNASKASAAWYRDASADGSRVFFTSNVELTNDANTGPEDNAANLYEYDFEKPEGERLSDLTVDSSDSSGAAVLGLVTASEDGSYVYLVAQGKLTSEKNAGGKEPVAGTPNLYLSHAGRVTFIATLAPSVGEQYHETEDSRENGENGDEENWVGLENVDVDFGPGQHTVRVTPNGTQLAFESVRPLTKYNNEASAPGECANERCREVYLYDATTGKLACVSCNPSGARPIGLAELGSNTEDVRTTHSLPYYLPRNLSEDGGRLFFQSPDALVPYDSNGLLDVYEWERPGMGSCTPASPSFSESTGGCVFPISDVAGDSESYFMDASASGDDAFIATGDQLVPGDTDSREDVYDVRVGGGFPMAADASAVCVNEDSCRPPVAPQPGVFGVPASATFSGPGNPAPPPTAVAPVVKVKVKPKSCRRGFVRNREHKCVRRGRARKAMRAGARRRGAGS